jgi:hypothetical protein
MKSDRHSDRTGLLVVVGLSIVGLVQMLFSPRRTLRVIRGGSWWS